MKNLIASIAFTCSIFATMALNAQERESQDTRVRQSRPKVGVPVRRDGHPVRNKVSHASHTQVIHEGVIHDNVIHEGVVSSGCTSCDGGCDGGCDAGSYDTGSCVGCGGGGCDSCSVGGNYCGGCSAPRGFCLCFPAHGWVHAEYLLWYPSGMRVPALVTTSTNGTARAAAGVLGQPNTSILFGGNDDVMSDDRSGFRIRFGWWLSAFPNWGIEGEYVGLGDASESFFRQSTGDPILARPFFNALTGAEDSELVAFPNVVTGSIGVDVNSEFDGAAFRLRRQLCAKEGCCFSNLRCKTVPYSSRLDATIGYRFWELDESIQVREQLQMIGTGQALGNFDIVDRFATRNQFNGAELGFIWQGRRGWWSLDALMRVGIGNVHQTVSISGTTQTVANGVTSNFDNGILAQRTNSGTFDRDQFTMVPEFGLNLGYQLTRRLRATLGYSAIYWGNVVRPGDQIDLDVNPNLFPPELNPFAGPLKPQFDFVETDYLVQGLSFGAEFRW